MACQPAATTGRVRPCSLFVWVPSLLALSAGLTSSSWAAAPAKPAAGDPPKLMARVNGQNITREELAQECLRHYGTEVLESVVNKHLIVEQCKRHGITVTKEEVDAEIERMATRFGLTLDHWLKMLKQERGIKPAQYANDIVWPTIALRKLAGQELQVTADELNQEFESQYGPAVKARLIMKTDRHEAEAIRAKAAADPAQFGNLAKDQSDDASASMKGLIQPIRRHTGYKEIEQVVFNMQDGEVSPVISVGGQFAILKREQLVPAADVTLEQVRPRLEEVLKDRKMRGTAHDIFAQLQQAAQVQNVLNDPALRQRMPGVAATINGAQITLRDLAEACIDRHGDEVLEGAINRKLIEQAVTKAGVTVTEADIDAEIARAASTMIKLKPDGSPDIEGWLQTITAQQRITVEVYRRDMVWPSVALKKLVDDRVQVTDDDLRRGYEANYGPRMRCRAIVLPNPRQAQRVWELARRDPTPETFGRLAEQYSIEPGSRANQGEVPPIKKWGGQPILEREAFAMKPGELSSIIQSGDKYVILLCEGQTESIGVDFASVRDILAQDIREKKLRLSMGEFFEQLQAGATIDNFLAGTSRSPKKKGGEPRFPPGTPLMPSKG